ncbi:MAG: 3'-5' exonuclease [Bacteriovoracaceae bacterium]|nr:3'-5' exonuclease [Bacteriovoracaceae bacterium]
MPASVPSSTSAPLQHSPDSKDTKDSLFHDVCFSVIDLETTGGNPKKDRIFEIGIVKIKNLKIIAEKGLYINPQIPIPEFIQHLTSISMSDIQDAPIIDEVIQEIRDFIGDDIVVAHNINFDIPFLNAVLKKHKKLALKNQVLCTQVMTQYLIPDIMNSNLPYLCDIFHIEHEKAHRALSDAKATGHLLIYYLKNFLGRGIKKINQIYYPKYKFELDKFHVDRKHINNLLELGERLKKIHSPFTITLKQASGEVSSFLCFESYKHFQSALALMEESWNSSWDKLTIKLHGSYLETILTLRDAYPKMRPQSRKTSLSTLIDMQGVGHSMRSNHTSHLQNKKRSVDENELKTVEGDSQETLNRFIKDYALIATHHLIDGQIVIYHAPYFSLKHSFVVKLPSQKRKIVQYIESLQKKDLHSFKSYWKNYSGVELIDTLAQALSIFAENKGEYLFFNHQEMGQSSELIANKIVKFSDHNKSKHRFPLHHL